jgi:8-oxo-dGTP pyrophosphatase MutT (NUDIX family)
MDNRVLVIRRGLGVQASGWWTLPSGRVEPGESQAAALAREVREELGIEVTPVAKVWECDTDDGAYRLHWWTAARDSDELHPDRDEVEDPRWLTTAEFLALDPTFIGDREFFLRVLPTLG